MMSTMSHPRTGKRIRLWRCLCAVVTLMIPAGGVLADAPLDPLPVPEYSFDLESPTVQNGIVESADVLSLAFPHPASLLSRSTLGLESPLDDVDALSASNASVDMEAAFDLLFSVDRDSAGVASPSQKLLDAGIPYNMRDQAWRGQQAGDQFISTEAYTRLGEMTGELIAMNNYLVRNNFDEGGTDFGAEPTTHAYDIVQAVSQDRVDATARLVHGEGEIPHAYFSLTPESPSLIFLGWDGIPSGATIYHASPWISTTGACCFSDFDCSILTEIECLDSPAAGDAFWLGPDTTCDMCQPAPMEGACCFPDGSCEILTEMECFGGPGMMGGFWLGPETTCEMCEEPVEMGACCFPHDRCEILAEFECSDGRLEVGVGFWLGPDTTCDMCQLPPMEGACCLFRGGCEITSPEACTDGDWLGRDATCDMCQLPPMEGACCLFEGGCTITSPEACIEGIWLGPEMTCEMCDQWMGTGACCYDAGFCEILPEFECRGGGLEMEVGLWLGPETTCGMCPVDEPGACCFPDGTCQMLTEIECLSAPGLMDGSWLGSDTTCEMCGPPAADVMWVRVYATHQDLGLLEADDIDALIVFDNDENGCFDGTDQVLFSLSVDSPSLGTIPGASVQGAAADVFVVRPGQTPALFTAATSLGLGAPSDNIDALDYHLSASLLAQAWPATQHGIRGSIASKKAKPWAKRLLESSVMMSVERMIHYLNPPQNQR